MRYHARETATVIETSQVSDDRDGSQKCHVMFYNGFPAKGKCPGGGPSGTIENFLEDLAKEGFKRLRETLNTQPGFRVANFYMKLLQSI